MKAVLLAIALGCLGMAHASAQGLPGVPNLAAIADSKSWTLVHASAEGVEMDGRRAVRLTADRLLVGGNQRQAGLFVDSAEGIYANFRITPNP